MSARARRVAVLAGGLGFAALFAWGARGLPPAGRYQGPYGYVLNQVAVSERHATDVVSAVTFDYRGFDTLGEEFILFASVIGVALLLRKHKDEGEQSGSSKGSEAQDKAASRRLPSPSDAIRTIAVGLVGINVVFGLYIITHGQVSPGGGFQGGVILATAPLLVYLAGDARRFLRIVPHTLVEVAEACGAAGLVLLGLLGLIRAGAFLQNVLPLGPEGEINSGGTILLLNVTTGLEVAAGFVFLLSAFLEQTLRRRLKHAQREER